MFSTAKLCAVSALASQVWRVELPADNETPHSPLRPACTMPPLSPPPTICPPPPPSPAPAGVCAADRAACQAPTRHLHGHLPSAAQPRLLGALGQRPCTGPPHPGEGEEGWILGCVTPLHISPPPPPPHTRRTCARRAMRWRRAATWCRCSAPLPHFLTIPPPPPF